MTFLLSNKIRLTTIFLCFAYAVNGFADVKMKCTTSVIKNMERVSQLKSNNIFNEISISDNGQNISMSVNLKALSGVDRPGLIEFGGALTATESRKTAYHVFAKDIEYFDGGSQMSGLVFEMDLLDFIYNQNAQVEFTTLQILVRDAGGKFIKDMRVFGKTVCK